MRYDQFCIFFAKILNIKNIIFWYQHHFWKKWPKILRKKKTKSDYISRTGNRTKKLFVQKIERQVNSNLPCKLDHLWRKLNFWSPKTSLWTPKNNDGHKISSRDMKFYAHHHFYHITHLLCQDGHFWRGGGVGGVCISL